MIWEDYLFYLLIMPVRVYFSSSLHILGSLADISSNRDKIYGLKESKAFITLSGDVDGNKIYCLYIIMVDLRAWDLHWCLFVMSVLSAIVEKSWLYHKIHLLLHHLLVNALGCLCLMWLFFQNFFLPAECGLLFGFS